VIAGRNREHTSRAFVVAETRKLRHSASKLEGPGQLQAFKFQKHARAMPR